MEGEQVGIAWQTNRLTRPSRYRLLQMLVHQLRHLEHVDGRFAAEYRLQRAIGVDHPLVLLVLEAVFLDIGPEPLGDLRAWNRLGADDVREGAVRRHGPHERSVRGALASTSLLLRTFSRFPRRLLRHVSSFRLRALRSGATRRAGTRAHGAGDDGRGEII